MRQNPDLNMLSTEIRIQILTFLFEGKSRWANPRVACFSINTVNKLLVDTGKTFQEKYSGFVRFINGKKQTDIHVCIDIEIY